MFFFPFPLACGSCFIALTKKIQDTNVCIRWRIVALFIFQHEVKCNEVSLCLWISFRASSKFYVMEIQYLSNDKQMWLDDLIQT